MKLPKKSFLSTIPKIAWVIFAVGGVAIVAVIIGIVSEHIPAFIAGIHMAFFGGER